MPPPIPDEALKFDIVSPSLYPLDFVVLPTSFQKEKWGCTHSGLHGAQRIYETRVDRDRWAGFLGDAKSWEFLPGEVIGSHQRLEWGRALILGCIS